MSTLQTTKFISFVGEFEFEAIRGLLDTLDALKQTNEFDRVELTLVSLGGYFRSAFAVFDYLRAYSKPVDIIASGCCHSCAMVVLQAARQRFARPHTDFALHRAWHYIPERTDLESIKRQTTEFEREEDLFWSILGSRAKMSGQELRDFFSVERFLGVEEALHLGLIDAVEGKTNGSSNEPRAT